MQKIKFNYDASYTISAPVSSVYEFFRKPDNICACISDIDHFELLDSNTARCKHKTKRDFGIVFSPEYILRYYYSEPEEIRWKSLDGNVDVNAIISLRPIDTNMTRITVNEEISFELQVSSIMAKLVRSIAAIETRNEMIGLLRTIETKLSASGLTESAR